MIVMGNPATSDHWVGPEDQRPQKRNAEYWFIYRHRASRFLVWGWSHFRQ